MPPWAVPPGRGGLCRTCWGPARPGYARCFQCDLHLLTAPGPLADIVAPVAYASKGGQHARDLWVYKAGLPGSEVAGAALLARLLVFLHDHGPCLWRQLDVSGPAVACVVPSGRGRAGPHPLAALVTPYLTLPWARLHPHAGTDPWARELDPARFRAGPLPAGAAVLLLDDTWTSGASVQSAALALKQAGAGPVAVVVLGRHVQADAVPADVASAAVPADVASAAVPACAVASAGGASGGGVPAGGEADRWPRFCPACFPACG